jgi:hypothetical protein
MDEETWKHIRQILKELEDENGFVTFPVTGQFSMSGDMYTFYTDEVMKILCEQWDPIDASDTSLAQDMLAQIGINV